MSSPSRSSLGLEMVVVSEIPPLSFLRKVMPGGLLVQADAKALQLVLDQLLWLMGFRQSQHDEDQIAGARCADDLHGHGRFRACG